MSDSPFTSTVPQVRGIILRDEDDKIIVQASREDVKRFAPQRRGQPVQLRPAPADVRLRLGSRQTWPRVYASTYSGGWPQMSSMMTTSDPTETFQSPQVPARLDPADFLYDRYGNPVANIIELRVLAEPVDVTTFGGTRQFINGTQTVEIEAVGLPGVQVLR